MSRVAVLGSVTIDEQVHDDGKCVRQVGGVATYGTMAMASAGVRATAVSNIGGPSADRVMGILKRLGVAVSWGRAQCVTAFRNYLHKDGSRTQDLLAMAASIRLSEIEEMLGSVEIVHLGPVHENDIGRDVLDHLPSTRCTVTLDVQGYLRSSELGPIRPHVSRDLPRALAASSIVKADHDEVATMEAVFGKGAAGIAEEFALNEIVVTRGRNGGYVQQRDGNRIEYPGIEVKEITDPTGAGDVFFGMYVVSRCVRGLDVAKACELASRRSAMQVSGRFVRTEDLRI